MDRAARARSFDRAADAYARARPGYPAQALRACLPAGARQVLDLAAGTGRISEGLLALDPALEIVAVEPSDEMRAHLPGPVTALAGTAEAIPLPDAAVDAVLVGQAYHWFDPERAPREIARVLRPGGTLGILWNALDDHVPWVAAVCEAFRGEDRRSRFGIHQPWHDVPGLTEPELTTVDHEQPSDADALAESISTRSVVVLAEPGDRAAILDRVRAAAPPGRFGVPYVCYIWRGMRVN